MAQIKTYARLKPSKKPYPGYKSSKNVLTIEIPESKDMINIGSSGQHIRSNMSYDIIFSNIFLPDATQEDVFDGVAKDIIQNFLNGYNGTIFAYGQTGTGKTFTVEGNSCRYKSRGLATRALSMIYQQLENRTEEHISVYLSYLEIYQEVAYDLLNPASRTMLPVIPFAKVTVVEGPRGSCILRGLSLHLAANEEIAQMLLLQGQANRHVAETPVNQRSSRSHGVFSVYLQARKHDSQTIISSKLHLVDLAGSERVSKTGVDGQQLTEAKSINLSLHHLETVIISLQSDRGNSAAVEREREKAEVNPTGSKSATSLMSNHSSDASIRNSRYVPYRNSLLTMILRDSLGGNCLTAMIATISLEAENLGESISTCRFAQRVARIANYARRNEEVDDKILIKKLKHKVAELENQVALLRSKGISGPVTDEDVIEVLTDQDRTICASVMEEYLQGVIHDPISAGICRVSQFRECLNLLKSRFQETSKITQNSIMAENFTCEESKSLAYHRLLQDGGDHASVALKEDDSSSHAIRYSHSLHEILATQSSQSTQSTLTSTSEPSMNLSHSLPITTSSGWEPQGQVVEKSRSPPQTSQTPPQTSQPEKDVDDVDRLMMLLGNSNGYKSPYERKREKEIKKLGKKLNTMGEQKLMKEEELEVMKQDMVLQSLQMEEDGMRLKLKVSDEQVADQHAYLLQLKHLQADPDLIAREMLVEKQLRKRQAKFRAKLEDIQERKDGVERELSQFHDQQPHSSSGKDKPTFEEKFGQHKQSKGSLNTRQVFDMLKNEEKRHKKDVGIMEREKTIMKTKQLELKELATLEKLRELKQILKMSQKYQDQEGISSMPEYQEIEEPLSDNFTNNKMKEQFANASHQGEICSNSEQDLGLRMDSNFKPLRREETFVAGSEVVSVSESVSQHNETVLSSHSRSSIENFVQSNAGNLGNGANTSGRNMVNGSWAQYLSQDDKSHYYSGLHSTFSSNSHEKNKPLFQHDTQLNSEFSSRKGLTAFENVEQSSHLPPAGSSQPRNQSNNNDNKRNNSSGGNKEEQIIVDDLEMTDNVDGNAPVALEFGHTIAERTNESSQGIENSNVSNETDVGKDLKIKNLGHMSALDILDSLKPTTIGMSNSQGDGTSVPVLPPSEYINFMMTNEAFDARKMGLSSRTFESALSHMLDNEENNAKANVPELPYRLDPYEKYSRTSNSPSHSHSKHFIKKPSKQGVSHSSSSSRERDKFRNDTTQRERERNSNAEKNRWRPELKNASIAERLAGLLDTPSGYLPTADKGSMNRSGGTQSYQEESLRLQVEDLENTLEQPTHAVEKDETVGDEDSFFGQVTPRSRNKALSKDEGEKTYMSRVAEEKERVAKIRKARQAAEMIQRNWRKYRGGP